MEQLLLAEAKVRKPAPAVVTGSPNIVTLLQSLIPQNLAPATRPRPGLMRHDWNTVVCFSCGKAGHSATRRPDLNEAFLYMLPGWKAKRWGWLCYDFPPRGSRASPGGKQRLIGVSRPELVMELDPRM